MADTKIVKSDEPLPAGKMMFDDKGRVFGIAIEGSRPNDDGTHTVNVLRSGAIEPISTHNISPVYMDYTPPLPWYVRLWRWMRR